MKLFQHIKKFQSVFFLLGLLVAVEGNVYANGYKGQLLAQNTSEGIQDNEPSLAKATHHAFGFVFHLVDLPFIKPCFGAAHQQYQHRVDIAQRQNQTETLIIKPLLASVQLAQPIYHSSTDIHPISLV